MRRTLLAASLLAASFAVAGAPPPRNAALHAFFEREFLNDLAENPETATFLGVAGHDDRLTDFAPESAQRRRARVRSAIAELQRFNPAKLSAQDRLSREVMLDDLRRTAQMQALFGPLPFDAGTDLWLPITTMWGPHETWSSLAKALPMLTPRDFENYLKRLDAMPRVLDQLTATMRAGMRWGWVPPRAAMVRVPALLDTFVAEDPTATPLWEPFTRFPPGFAPAERERLTAAGRAALATKVRPAFVKLRAFLAEEYLPAAGTSVSASRLPAGPRYYELLAQRGTTTRQTPEEIHAIGLSEVARIRAAMERVIQGTAFKGTFAEFLTFLRTDPRFYFTSAEERLRFYRDIAKRADAELPKFFAELPRTPYGIRAMEAFEGDNSDQYIQPALDGSRAGFFEANVNNLSKRPTPEMESTLLHEAVPGHHLQIARALELKDLPRFRRTGGYTAYQEGWALYAESLGYEMGFYKDPYQHFGALQGEMLRACRLVIDTGLHAKGWGREQSIRYLMENTGANEGHAIAEVDRYIIWPGQALGYKVGELKIKALRAKAAAALGARFDVRRFHNAVLDDGALPLTVLEARIDEWIQSEKGRKQ